MPRRKRAPIRLPPRDRRPLGHQERRRDSVRLSSRTGYFRVSGMWGSFAFDVIFRSFIGVTVGLLIGLRWGLERASPLSPGDWVIVQTIPSLHMVAVYIWQSRNEKYEEQKGVTRWGFAFGCLYGLILPPIVAGAG